MLARQAATKANVTVKALRYYEQIGLLAPGRLPNGYRHYTEQDVRFAAEIRALTRLGLSPSQARPFLECLRTGHERADDCAESIAAYQSRIDALNGLIARLSRERDDLTNQMRMAARRGFRAHRDNGQARPMRPEPDPLPPKLPVPDDDGAARHLPGRMLPPLTFRSTGGEDVRLDDVSAGRWVLYLYPLTGEPGVDVPRGWNEIPGARGCSQQACSFRDNLAALQDHGVHQVLAVSTDDGEYQLDLVRRLHLPYPMVSDPELSLARTLDLPTFEFEGTTLYKRLTMVIDGDTIEHVFYPVFPPDRHADEVLDWLKAHPPADRA